jgi:hypothetical protein
MAESVSIEFTSPSGEPLRIEWRLGSLASAASDESRAWRLDGDLDWDEIEAVRVLSAALGEERAVALAAVRPAGAAGHGDEAVAAILVSEGAAEQVDEALLSTEYGPDELPRRVGIELYREGDPIPPRVAADVTEAATGREGGVTDVRATLAVRLDGKATSGLYEILTPA